MWWSKLRGRRGREEDLRDEMAAHLEFEIEARLADGMPRDQAEFDARRSFGNATRIAERTREAWTVRWIEAPARDLRWALRSMARRPGFTAVAVVSLAIALGANTAVFSFVNTIVLKKLPVADAGRLAILGQKNEQFHMENCCFSYAFWSELRKQTGDFEDVLGVSTRDVTLADREEVEKLRAEAVTGNYFRMLGVRPAAGRLLEESDDVEGASPACVISYKLWQNRFAGDPAVVGRRVSINGQPVQIVGVSERGFPGASLHNPSDLQAPLAMAETLLGTKRAETTFLLLIARRKPGVTAAQAAAWLNPVGRQIQTVTGPRMGPHDDFVLHDGSQGISSGRERMGQPVLVLLLLVGVLLLAACANVSALLLVRSAERTREAGMRAAVGASRAELFRQFLTEAALMAGAGGVAGWILALALIRALLGLLPQADGLTRLVRPDALVFTFSCAVAVLAALLFGLLPAWRASRADPLSAIRGTALASPGRRRMLSSGIIAAQIALSLALVFCAALFGRTLHNLRSVDLGLQAENVAILPVDLARTGHEQQAESFYTELLRRSRELPESRAAALTQLSVLSGGMQSIVLTVPGYAAGRMRPVTYWTRISGGYFRTLGTPLVAGRDFTDRDSDGRSGEGVAIVNEQFARQFFAGEALGKAFTYGGGRQVRVVGVARTAKFRYIREDPHPVMYLPVTRGGYPESLYLVARTASAAPSAIGRLQAIVRELGPRVPPGAATTMQTQLDEALSRERLLAFLSTLLGAVAAALAAIGLYGVLAFAVTRRTREIGIRLSVGAQRSAIVALFLKESAWIVASGVAAGIPLVLGCGRLAASLLYGIQGQDASIIAFAAAALTLVAAAAAAIPAIRAARVDPMRALRHE